jgi:hypothetical protein
MSTVFARFEEGREWIMHVKQIPVRASHSRACQMEFVKPHSGGTNLEVGTVLVECLRNEKGVQAAVVLPNGYCFPTGRIAPKDHWFQMLKVHLRSWLVMTPQGRIIRIVNEGTQTLNTQIAAKEIDETSGRRAISKLEEFRTAILGELPTNVSENDLLAGFYNWVTLAAAQSGMEQPEIVAIVDRALRTGKTVFVPDLAEDVLNRDCQRYLDI